MVMKFQGIQRISSIVSKDHSLIFDFAKVQASRAKNLINLDKYLTSHSELSMQKKLISVIGSPDDKKTAHPEELTVPLIK